MIVESEVLAPWRIAVERLAGVDLSKLHEEAGSSREGIVRYARTRDEAWTTFVEAAREGDSAKFEKGNALMQEADEMVAALGDEEPDPASAEPMATAAEP